MSEQEQLIIKVCDEVKDLLIRKNRDYGSSFSVQYEKYGILSSMIRIDDKIKRIENLIKGHAPEVEESLKDSVMDLCGYAALTLVEMGKNSGKN